MVVVMKLSARDDEVAAVRQRLEQSGFQVHFIQGVKRLVMGAVGEGGEIPDALGLEALPGVEKVVPIMKPYKLVSLEAREEGSQVRVKEAVFGGQKLVVIAGPCAVEGREQLLEAAWQVKKAGAGLLRGGAFKPRTSPYSFQGLQNEGLRLLAEVSAETGLPTVTEVIDEASLDLALEYVDMVQIGARNMQNFSLLRLAGRAGKPIILKRGLSATVDEWLMAAEYIVSEGNDQVVLCERGIRTFENATRNTLDLSAVPLVKGLSHLPVIVDPSHATGIRSLVGPMARAAVAAGADGLLIEVHPDPARALSDGPQSLTPAEFSVLMREIRAVAAAVGRHA
ncbi:MAG: 3-deoxy-7-phosphoheptulonate synthase [Thermacetogeniaceae bacterium]